MQRLTGKWALITGASRGIGQQVALGLAQHGCNCILHARRLENLTQTQDLLKQFTVATLCAEGDLADPAAVQLLIAHVKKQAPVVDILYNNAGLQNSWKEANEQTTAEWLEIFHVNLFSLVALTNAFYPSMRERGYGRIVSVTSGIADIPQMAPYSAAKAALDKYTADMAAELKGTNVLINTVDPGWLRTDLGGPEGEHDVSTVVPGALIPVLLDDFGPQGECFHAQQFKYLHD